MVVLCQLIETETVWKILRTGSQAAKLLSSVVPPRLFHRMSVLGYLPWAPFLGSRVSMNSLRLYSRFEIWLTEYCLTAQASCTRMLLLQYFLHRVKSTCSGFWILNSRLQLWCVRSFPVPSTLQLREWRNWCVQDHKLLILSYQKPRPWKQVR